jgi:hypothetical protein
MKLTIITSDKAVYIDGVSYANLVWSGTPSNVRALQFDTIKNVGHIEFNDGTINEDITSLPDWVSNAQDAWTQADANSNITVPSPTLTDAEKLALVRNERNNRLFASDWTQLPDASLAINKAAWAIYRQALRDLPKNINDINNVIYPIPPSNNE